MNLDQDQLVGLLGVVALIGSIGAFLWYLKTEEEPTPTSAPKAPKKAPRRKNPSRTKNQGKKGKSS